MKDINLKDYVNSNNLNENLNFNNDIYFNKNYAELYGDVFYFHFQKNGFKFTTLGNKQNIPQTNLYDISSPYGYSGIYCNTNDKEFLELAFKELKKKALEENIIAFFIRFHPFDHFIAHYNPYLHFMKQDKKIIIVPTFYDESKIKNNYSSRIKSYVNKSKKELKIDYCTKKESESFRKLYYATMKRNNASSFYYFKKDYFKKLFDLPQSIVLKAVLNHKIIAFASFFLCENFSYYHLSANTLESNANLALLDFFFQLSHKNNVKFCILGGGMNDYDSLFNFKQKFSKLNTHFTIGGIVFDTINYNRLNQKFNNNNFLKYRFNS